MMVTSEYTHIWDCCCDHGLLGAALLSRQAAPNIHFVDIVPELMQELEQKLHRFYADSISTWTTHCLDVEHLPLDQYQGKHLVIISGVGGDLMTQFVNAIHQHHSMVNIDLLLCPVHHQFVLRQKLMELDFSLKDEILVEENQRFYEIISVSSKSDEGTKIDSVGNRIWQVDSPEQLQMAKKYLNKTLSHYQRISQGNKESVQHIIDAYLAVKLNE